MARPDADGPLFGYNCRNQITMNMMDRLRHESVRDLSSAWTTGELAALGSRSLPISRRAASTLRTCSLLLADAIAFALSLALASAYVSPLLWPDDAPAVLRAFAAVTAGVMGGLVAYFAAMGHYHRRLPFWIESRHVLCGNFVAFTITGSIAFWTDRSLPRHAFLAMWLLFPVFDLALRSAGRRALELAGLWRMRVLIVGTGETSRHAQEALLSQSWLGYDVVEVVPSRVLDKFHAESRMANLLDCFNADVLVLATEAGEGPSRAVVESLIRTRLPFSVMQEMDGLPVFGCDQTSFFSHDTVMLSYSNRLAKPFSRIAKVVFDVLAASIMLLILSPLFLLVTALIKLDGGAVLYAHRRIGADGRPFNCLKFRSMVVDSDAVLKSLLARDSEVAREWAQTHKLRDDPRITRVGRLLRKTSLDELPQLLNVLRLEMSLVGPRPIVASEAAKYADDIAFYYQTRPGITGLWQVSGRSDTSYDRRVQLDTWYVKNWSLWHDLAILAKTVPAVLKRRGAV